MEYPVCQNVCSFGDVGHDRSFMLSMGFMMEALGLTILEGMTTMSLRPAIQVCCGSLTDHQLEPWTPRLG